MLLLIKFDFVLYTKSNWNQFFISGVFYLCKKENEQIFNKNIAYLIPCYNESYEELDETVDSFINQNNIENNKKILIICCDGVPHNIT